MVKLVDKIYKGKPFTKQKSEFSKDDCRIVFYNNFIGFFDYPVDGQKKRDFPDSKSKLVRQYGWY